MTSLLRAAGKLKSQKLALLVAETADVTADTLGSAIDTIALDGDIWFLGMISHGTGTGSAILKVQHADTSGGSYTDVTGVVTIAAAATTGATLDVVVSRASLKRFVKALVDVTGTTAISGQCYAIGIKHV
jgi:hypothetical protein